DVHWRTNINGAQLNRQLRGDVIGCAPRVFPEAVRWASEHRDLADLGKDLLQKFYGLRINLRRSVEGQPCEVTSGSRKAGDEARADRVTCDCHDNGNSRGCPLCCHCYLV